MQSREFISIGKSIRMRSENVFGAFPTAWDSFSLIFSFFSLFLFVRESKKEKFKSAFVNPSRIACHFPARGNWMLDFAFLKWNLILKGKFSEKLFYSHWVLLFFMRALRPKSCRKGCFCLSLYRSLETSRCDLQKTREKSADKCLLQECQFMRISHRANPLNLTPLRVYWTDEAQQLTAPLICICRFSSHR